VWRIRITVPLPFALVLWASVMTSATRGKGRHGG
jgi:hypothetical protein